MPWAFTGLSWAGRPASLEGRNLAVETAANQAIHGGEPAMFGTINTTRTPMRELQIGAKFIF